MGDTSEEGSREPGKSYSHTDTPRKSGSSPQLDTESVVSVSIVPSEDKSRRREETSEVPDESRTDAETSVTETDVASRSMTPSEKLGIPRSLQRDRQRTVIITRAGERVDRLFPTWLQTCFTGGSGHYLPFDINLPVRLPNRRSYLDFELDPPLTEMGKLQSQLVGRSMKVQKNHLPDFIFTSPSLRCIQTASYIKSVIGDGIMEICVEPGLFEWTKW